MKSKLAIVCLVAISAFAADQKQWKSGTLLDNARTERFAGATASTWDHGTTTTASARYSSRVQYIIRSEGYIYFCEDLPRTWKTIPAVNEAVRFYVDGDHLWVQDFGGGKDHKMRIDKKVADKDPLDIR